MTAYSAQPKYRRNARRVQPLGQPLHTIFIKPTQRNRQKKYPVRYKVFLVTHCRFNRINFGTNVSSSRKKSASGIARPSTRMRSRQLTRCGLVIVPT